MAGLYFRRTSSALVAAIISALIPAAAQAGPFDSCTVLLSTPGALGFSTTGMRLSTLDTGGIKAIVAVTATGAVPTILVSAPSLSGPAASIAGATTRIAYTTLSGTTQVYTAGASSYVMRGLADTITMDAETVNTSGFRSGSYTISTAVTCQQ